MHQENGPIPQRPSTLLGRLHTISDTLYSALVRIREHISFQPNSLWWIDSLCIYRDDKEEMATQVGLMTDIYRNAEMVICYLGEPKTQSRANIEDLHRALPALSAIATLGTRENFGHSLQQIVEQPYAWKPLISETAILSSIDCITSSKWFTRGWTFQEALLLMGSNWVFRVRRCEGGYQLIGDACHLFGEEGFSPEWFKGKILEEVRLM